jgi:hypothetical protein
MPLPHQHVGDKPGAAAAVDQLAAHHALLLLFARLRMGFGWRSGGNVMTTGSRHTDDVAALLQCTWLWFVLPAFMLRTSSSDFLSALRWRKCRFLQRLPLQLRGAWSRRALGFFYARPHLEHVPNRRTFGLLNHARSPLRALGRSLPSGALARRANLVIRALPRANEKPEAGLARAERLGFRWLANEWQCGMKGSSDEHCRHRGQELRRDHHWRRA